ncbi:MAG TPA: FliA/WhiG family RNA polymerase sigma factor [Acidobacteriaceae bacterium]|jgi:RNA polymerase sigma factor for flagellar operon FliA|nr:FliA/WhiG family RNA polymerase sigma factor [Acidobacteriaceae bacterium]
MEAATDVEALANMTRAASNAFASGAAAIKGYAMDSEERDRLLLEHLPSVRFIARRIHERLPQYVDLEDLVGAGVVGLIDAFLKFDTSKDVQFNSYAKFRVRGAILDSLRELDWGPRELRRKGRSIEEAIQQLIGKLGRTPNEQEVADALGLSLAEYQEALADLKGLEIGALNAARNDGSDEEELAYVPGSPEEDPLFLCMRSEMRRRLAWAIEQLPERERLVLTLSYYEEMTLREIGLTLEVSEARVSQIRSSAVLAMRALLATGATEKGQRPTKGKREETRVS